MLRSLLPFARNLGIRGNMHAHDGGPAARLNHLPRRVRADLGLPPAADPFWGVETSGRPLGIPRAPGL